MRYLMAVAVMIAAGAAAALPVPPPKISFTYPAVAARIPALKAWLDAQEGPFRAGVQGQAAADAREAAKEGRTALPFEASRTWQVVADLPRFISLSVDRYDYTGGAHGMDTFGTIVWDKQASTPREPVSFFIGAAPLSRAIRPEFCRRLDAERRRKRQGFNVDDKEFNACLDPAKETIILGSASRTRFDRIGVLVAPYDAGPYAEGHYDVTVPITPAVLASVRPEWRRYFAVAGTP